MEWFKLIFIGALAVIGTTGNAETNRRPSKPIEVTLPTSKNPAVLETNSGGKIVLNATKDFPPAPPAPVDTVTQVEDAPTVMEALSRLPASNSDSAEPNVETRPTLPAAAEAAVILSRNQFYPSRINVPQGTRVRIWFTTVEPRPAALVVEGLKMQRWIASENNSVTAGNSPGYFELQREVTRDRVTEITLQPNAGTYPFFDALSGARGEIVVE